MKYRILLILSSIIFTSAVEAHPKQYKVRVIETKPVYQYVSIDTPQQYCNDIYVEHDIHKASRIIVGSLVGGTLGNLSSSRNNKESATVLGAIIGGVIGSQMTDSSPHSHISQQCHTRYVKTEKVRVITGYHYWYQIKGKIYQGYSEDKPLAYATLRK
jgi:uncharacterized protein YcfJ